MRIIVVEDQNLVLDSLVNLISGELDFEVVKALTDASFVDAACEKLRPDVVLMDVCTENGSSGLKAAVRLHRDFPDIKVIIMTGLPDLSFIDEAREAGVFSFIYKNLNARDLIAVLRQAEKNYSTWPTKPTMPILGYNELSEREVEVLRFYCRGMSRQDIAEHYGLSENTVKGYVRSILSKTGYDSIAKLTMYALANGYITPHGSGPPGEKATDG
ncbi:response regulator transcription factor [Papillibacter cinnamivorans]|uniref:Stage 0 sporulation protein A homolog n=1 Tax=Papillibacter cinnamivorans DSM 12816 TaxID=1122930 RepID=A0A1W2AS40_9FIRM|nr:response regulator transcription factor [Papillibacter cinnamivorans]SMC63505.1 two component transcriptional regulator, LuxR family [Papillibacter cinnamivorans DSM 12816]